MTKKLNTPVKRIGGLFLFLGLPILLYCLLDLLFYEDSIRSFLSAWLIYSWTGYGLKYDLFRMSNTLVIIGLLFSYLYDFGVGRIVRWIKEG